MKGDSMTKLILAASTVGGVLIATIITSIMTQKPTKIYKKANAWKKERIRNAFYDTITQEDVAWG